MFITMDIKQKLKDYKINAILNIPKRRLKVLVDKNGKKQKKFDLKIDKGEMSDWWSCVNINKEQFDINIYEVGQEDGTEFSLAIYSIDSKGSTEFASTNSSDYMNINLVVIK